MHQTEPLPLLLPTPLCPAAREDGMLADAPTVLLRAPSKKKKELVNARLFLQAVPGVQHLRPGRPAAGPPPGAGCSPGHRQAAHAHRGERSEGEVQVVSGHAG